MPNIITNPSVEDLFLTPYKSYIAILMADGPSSQTSGLLAVGRKYMIDTYVAGDDFINVGAASNEEFVEFVATGTTPTNWTNASTIAYAGEPSIQGNLQAQNSEDSNFIGDIVWTRDGEGDYVGTLVGAFRQYKTLFFVNVTADDLSTVKTIQGGYDDDDNIRLRVFDDAGAPVDFWIAYINIIVYPA